MADVEYYDDLLRRVFAGSKLIICADVLVAAGAYAKQFAKFGAQRPFVIAGTEGTGELPVEDDCEWVVLNTGRGSMMENIRAFERALTDLPGDVLAKLDAYDPGREAIVTGGAISFDGVMWGRRTFGGRPQAWNHLEDKLILHELLDAAGIERTPCEIVPAADDALRAAARLLDRGLGTAWAADNREGWWGGAQYLRWVRTEDDADEAVSFFGAHCDRVRVMPFLDGVPCSIHGMVFADDVIAFRPVEMITLRRSSANRLCYAGLATYWDPPEADREYMRDAARKLGAVLRDRVNYRGVFTLDGVMTAEGFRPTEMNPRAGAGVNPQAAAAGVSIGLLSRLAREDDDFDLRPRELEALVVEAADANRRGGCYTVIEQTRTESELIAVRSEPSFRLAEDGEEPDGHIRLGPSGVGGFAGYQPVEKRVVPGPSFAPTAVRAFAFTDEQYGTRLGPLEAAPAVR
jgi:hypothetical protein